MTRNASHFQRKEPFLEKPVSALRYKKILPNIPKGSYVLDLGCGFDAKFLKTISPIIKKGVGIDAFVTKKGLEDNIKLISSSLDKKLPFDSNTFDAVTLLAVIEHLEQPVRLLQEVLRVLKPGGRLLITAPSRGAKPLLEFLAYKLKLLSSREVADHKHYFTEISLRGQLVKAGFLRNKIEVESFELGLNLFAKAIK